MPARTFPPLHWKQAWKHLGSESDLLHRIAVVDGAWEGDPDMFPTYLRGRTACGRSGNLFMPGMLSRMYATRCRQCCRAVGVPEGDGIPGNVKNLQDEPIADPDQWCGDDYDAAGDEAPSQD